jgi:hypothetical protein
MQSLVMLEDFWTNYFWLPPFTEFPGLESCRVEFPVAAAYALTLSFPGRLLYYSLGFRHPAAPEPVEIGAWSDDYPSSPLALRWEEADLIGRCVARGDPGLPHPGAPVLLLSRFTPFPGGDRDAAGPALRHAWQSLGLFTEQQIDRLMERVFLQPSPNLHWVRDAQLGWVLPDWGCMESLRTPQGSFPFAQYARMIEAGRSYLRG